MTETAKNTDRELYREPKEDGSKGGFYQAHVFVTKEGLIGMCVGGTCVVRSIENWVMQQIKPIEDIAQEVKDIHPMPEKVIYCCGKHECRRLAHDKIPHPLDHGGINVYRSDYKIQIGDKCDFCKQEDLSEAINRDLDKLYGKEEELPPMGLCNDNCKIKVKEEEKESKIKTRIRYAIELPDNKIHVEGLAMVLEEIMKKLDKLEDK